MTGGGAYSTAPWNERVERCGRSGCRWQRWADSGLTAKEYAAETGLNVNSLGHWRWKLSAEARGGPREQRPSVAPPLVEVKLAPFGPEAGHELEQALPFEVMLLGGRTLRVPPRFDASALRALLVALEAL